MKQAIVVLDSGVDFDNFAGPLACCSAVAVGVR